MSGWWGVRSGREEHLTSCSSLGLESDIQLQKQRSPSSKIQLKKRMLCLLSMKMVSRAGVEKAPGASSGNRPTVMCSLVLPC